MSNMNERWANVKILVQKLEKDFGFKIHVTCTEVFSDDNAGGDHWFLYINEEPFAGNMSFRVIEDQLDMINYLCYLGWMDKKAIRFKK